MNDVIEASYVWTIDEFLAANEALYRGTRNRFRFVALIPGFLLLAMVGYVVASTNPIVAAFCVVADIGILFLATRWFRRWRWRRLFLRAGVQAEADQKVVYVVDESRLRKISPGVDLSIIWELIPKVLELPDGFLVFPGAPKGYWLPNHAFRDHADRERFAAIAEHRARKYVRGRGVAPRA